MTHSLRTMNPPAPRSSSPFAEEALERRKKRLMAILSQGLPTLPHYVLDLTALLNKQAVDLKKVGNVIRTYPSLSAQVLRLCNSALFGLRRRVLSIEQAAILLGTERLRTLVLTCSVMQFAGKYLPKDQLMGFWQHSFLSALLSERIARQVDYFEKEQAYLGGLLHDIGQLPMWMLVAEEAAKGREGPRAGWVDNPELERDYFCMDHCKTGRHMAVAWNFMPSFIDVFETITLPRGRNTTLTWSASSPPRTSSCRRKRNWLPPPRRNPRPRPTLRPVLTRSPTSTRRPIRRFCKSVFRFSRKPIALPSWKCFKPSTFISCLSCNSVSPRRRALPLRTRNKGGMR